MVAAGWTVGENIAKKSEKIDRQRLFLSGFVVLSLFVISIHHLASEAYEKLCSALQKASLSKGIKMASSVEQTSCLEGYHSVINQFAPKMFAFSYLGMLARYVSHFSHLLHVDAFIVRKE